MSVEIHFLLFEDLEEPVKAFSSAADVKTRQNLPAKLQASIPLPLGPAKVSFGF